MTDTAARPNVSRDAWDRRANHLMLAYVAERFAAPGRPWGDERYLATSARIAAHCKNSFRDDMAARSTFPPEADQRQLWAETMQGAEHHIAEWMRTGVKPGFLGLDL